MPQKRRAKTREELLSTSYLNATEIARLLDLPYRQANKVFKLSQKVDQEQLKGLLCYDNKVRFKTVLKVSGTDLNVLIRQIKNAPAVEEHSAISK